MLLDVIKCKLDTKISRKIYKDPCSSCSTHDQSCNCVSPLLSLSPAYAVSWNRAVSIAVNRLFSTALSYFLMDKCRRNAGENLAGISRQIAVEVSFYCRVLSVFCKKTALCRLFYCNRNTLRETSNTSAQNPKALII